MRGPASMRWMVIGVSCAWFGLSQCRHRRLHFARPIQQFPSTENAIDTRFSFWLFSHTVAIHASRNRKKSDITDVTVVPLQLRQSEASATRVDCCKNGQTRKNPWRKYFQLLPPSVGDHPSPLERSPMREPPGVPRPAVLPPVPPITPRSLER